MQNQNWIELESGLLVNLNHARHISNNWIITGLSESECKITQTDFAKIKARLFPPQAVEVEVTTTSENVTLYEPKNTEAERALAAVAQMQRYITYNNDWQATCYRDLLKIHRLI